MLKTYRLLLLPIALMILSALYCSRLASEIEKSLLSEKYAEKKLVVDMIASQSDQFIELDQDWETDREYYRTSLVFAVEALDRTRMTYAMVFDEDLSEVSRKSSDDSSFDPTAYGEFRDAVGESGSGGLVLPYEPPGGPRRDVRLYYRWIPTGAEYENRFLVVVGISRLTVETSLAGWVVGGAVALIVITSALNVLMVFKLNGSSAEGLKELADNTEARR
jgi:hypothetical protein